MQANRDILTPLDYDAPMSSNIRGLSFGLLLLCVGLAGCSFLGIGEQSLARCQNDEECEPFTLALSEEEERCTVFVCETAAGECVPSTVDGDGDGEPATSCGGGDCDDTNPAIGPHAREVCGNDVDEDCSGEATDLDCDGVDACSDTYLPPDCDCDDLNANVSPLVGEVCNGVDDDCDGRLDASDEDDDGDGLADFCALAAGGAQDCDDEDASTYVGAPELCDGVDNDCFLNGELRLTGGRQAEPTEDFDSDGHAWLLSLCREPDSPILPKDDCNDLEPQVHPGAPESCDGVDEDCDGVVDEAEGSEADGSLCWPAALELGGDQGCLVRADGALLCWGEGRHDVRLIEGVPSPTELAAGHGLACALSSIEGEPRVICWGDGGAAVTTMGEVTLYGRPQSIAAGRSRGCAILDGGEVHCWGWPDAVGEPVANITGAVALSLGRTVSCAVLEDGRVHCWGQNDFGQLGDPSLPQWMPNPDCPTCGPMPYWGDGVVVGIDDATAVACDGNFCCALRDNGEVWCWGDNRRGQLGCDGEVDCGAEATPARVAGLTGVTQIAAGSLQQGGATEPYHDFACALLDSGEVWCWGSHEQGQLGVESVDEVCADAPCATTPVEATVDSGGEAILELSLGAAQGCVRTESGLRCWGRNGRYQLGTGVATSVEAEAVEATALVAPLHIDDQCFLLYEGELRCAVDDDDLDEPEAIRNARITAVSEGAAHGCALRDDGRVRCWSEPTRGFVDRGQLGGGEPFVTDLTDAVDLACGDHHCCALRRTGRIACWGDNSHGQLGVGDDLDDPLCDGCSAVPLPVEGLSQVMQIAAGGDHSCALSSGGRVACWGDNSRGQVGASRTATLSRPEWVSDLPTATPVVQLAASRATTCAVLHSGAVLCLGEGFDAATGGAFPWIVPGLFFIEEVAMTDDGLCALDASGGVWYRGTELFETAEVGPARTIGCGPRHCCATRTSGQAVCWGVIPAGLMSGLETTSMTPLPVEGLEGSTAPR